MEGAEINNDCSLTEKEQKHYALVYLNKLKSAARSGHRGTCEKHLYRVEEADSEFDWLKLLGNKKHIQFLAVRALVEGIVYGFKNLTIYYQLYENSDKI